LFKKVRLKKKSPLREKEAPLRPNTKYKKILCYIRCLVTYLAA
jgi:hypothetical protein